MSDLMVLVSRQNLEHWKRMCSDNPASVALMISHALSSEGSTEFFDAALAREAALREELTQFDQAMRALACNLGSGGYNAEFLTADQLANKIQWGIDNLLKVEQQRLTAAEQRNAELMSIIGDAFERLVCITPRNKPSGVLKQQAMEILQGAALKPTESGASE